MITSRDRVKSKSKITKLLSNQTSPKPIHKPNKTNSNLSDRLESRNSHQQAFSIQDPKSFNIHLSSPSSQSATKPGTKLKVKKESHIKGYKSKTNLKSPKFPNKSKKAPKDLLKINEIVPESREKERLSTEKVLKRNMTFESELKKALEENKILKKIIHYENQNEDLIEDLMKTLKSRLYKFLYE